MRDPVEHYQGDGIECIDAMRAISTHEQFVGYLRLTALKYLWRLGKKDLPSKEAKKAGDYVRWLHEELEAEEVRQAQDALVSEAEELGMYGERAETVKTYTESVKEFAAKNNGVPEEIKELSGAPFSVERMDPAEPDTCPHGMKVGGTCSLCDDRCPHGWTVGGTCSLCTGGYARVYR